jgi:hypothetical protein
MEGRFISKDPIGFAGGDVNIYAYTSNNPLNLTDAEGLSADVLTLPLELTCQFAKINPVTLGLGLATYPGSTSACSDYPPSDDCQKLPKKKCDTAIKILTQYERLANKFGKKIPRDKINQLNKLRDAGTITSNNLPGTLLGEFPGEFTGMTLNAIRQMCK